MPDSKPRLFGPSAEGPNFLPEWLMRIGPVMSATGLGRTKVFQGVRNKTFPAPLKLGRTSAWRASDIAKWIAEQIEAAGRKAA